MDNLSHITKKGTIDRFEGEYAVVLIDDDGKSILIARSKLPREAVEGSHLYFLNGDISIDIESETAARKKIRSLSKELFD